MESFDMLHPHSGERPILIALSVRSKHIRVRFITL